MAKYCSKDCQRAAWSTHKKECQKSASKETNGPSEGVAQDSAPKPTVPSMSIQDFTLEGMVGEGNFSSIFRAVRKQTGDVVAIKIIDKQRALRMNKTNDVMMEKHCLMRLKDHPNIIQLYDTFKDDRHCYFITEFVSGGELWAATYHKGCPLTLIRHYFAQIVNALQYLHSKGIVHRDLKAENVMLTETHRVKLIDFGTAKDLMNPEVEGSGNWAFKRNFKDFVGTPQFMSPEAIRNKGTDERSDLWSLGCLLFQMTAGFPPFHDGSDYLIFQRVLDRKLVFPAGFPSVVRELVEALVQLEPAERYTLQQVQEHPFLAGIDVTTAYLFPPVPTLKELCMSAVIQTSEAVCWTHANELLLDDSVLIKERLRMAKRLTPELDQLLGGDVCTVEYIPAAAADPEPATDDPPPTSS
eukprot:GILK01009595.1.p1 GENE.GILK01009595.1~~GILK01009595.1.p1  ORF type:complete len:444 (+),score=66.57 GILK01009595.1:99-1334(+)